MIMILGKYFIKFTCYCSYRTRDEIQEVRKTRDPITGFKDRIITAGLVTEEELKEIDKDVRKEVDEANNKALADGGKSYTHLLL
jgi:TPP-dependent pyruvate/acetoin dehydrogenase alpha subunit